MFGHVYVCLKLFLPLTFVDDSFVVVVITAIVVNITRGNLCHIGVIFVGDTILNLQLEFLFEMNVPIVLDIIVGSLW